MTHRQTDYTTLLEALLRHWKNLGPILLGAEPWLRVKAQIAASSWQRRSSEPRRYYGLGRRSCYGGTSTRWLGGPAREARA